MVDTAGSMGTALMEPLASLEPAEREADPDQECRRPLLAATARGLSADGLTAGGLVVRGLSESDREAAVRLSKLAGAMVSLAVAAPFGGPALDDPPAVVRAALELALLECADTL